MWHLFWALLQSDFPYIREGLEQSGADVQRIQEGIEKALCAIPKVIQAGTESVPAISAEFAQVLQEAKKQAEKRETSMFLSTHYFWPCFLLFLRQKI